MRAGNRQSAHSADREKREGRNKKSNFERRIAAESRHESHVDRVGHQEKAGFRKFHRGKKKKEYAYSFRKGPISGAYRRKGNPTGRTKRISIVDLGGLSLPNRNTCGGTKVWAVKGEAFGGREGPCAWGEGDTLWSVTGKLKSEHVPERQALKESFG